MKRSILVIITIFPLIISTAILLPVVNVVSANFIPTPGLYIQCPGSMIYSGNDSHSIPLWIEAGLSTGAPRIVSISYNVDGGANITLPKVEYTTYQPSGSPYNADIYYNRDTNLENLTDGSHTVRAYSRDVNGDELSASVNFTVRTSGESGIFLNAYPYGIPTPIPKPSNFSIPILGQKPAVTPLVTPKPTASITPTVTPKPTAQTTNFFGYLILFMAIVFIFAVSFVVTALYLKRKKKRD